MLDIAKKLVGMYIYTYIFLLHRKEASACR